MDGQCAICANHKPRSKNDCQVFKALFVNESPIASDNVHKLLGADGICLGWKPKEQKR